MIDTKTTVVSALTAILPTEWEMSVDSNSALPMITYRESNNYDYVTGNKTGYSKITYTLKLWTDKISEIASYEPQIDTVMRGLGFIRDNTNELVEDGIICKMFNYTALAKEEFI